MVAQTIMHLYFLGPPQILNTLCNFGDDFSYLFLNARVSHLLTGFDWLERWSEADQIHGTKAAEVD